MSGDIFLTVKKLAQCSEDLKEVTQVTEESILEDDNWGAFYAPAFFLLHRLGSERPKEYVKDISSIDIYETFNTESGGTLVYLSRLYNHYSDEPFSDIVREQNLIEKFENEQHVDGYIPDIHGPAVRGLVEIAPDAEVTKEAVDNVVMRHEKGASSGVGKSQISPAAGIALMEYDYNRYEEIVKSEAEKIEEKISRELTKKDNEVDHDTNSQLEARGRRNKDGVDRDLLLALGKDAAIFLSIVPDFESDVIDAFIDLLLEEFHEIVEEPPRKGNTRACSNGRLGIALLAAGHGPSIPKYQSQWQQDIEKQKRKQERPKFVSTYPATATGKRRVEIRDRAEKMIEKTEDILRVSTLRMDMLHHPIIDLLEEESDIDIRILTSSGKPSGAHQKMKRAVMEELIRKTEGNVKEHDLLHSRIVVSDKREALISTADLTREQLHDEFNAGVYTKEKNTVKEVTSFFDKIWEQANHRG